MKRKLKIQRFFALVMVMFLVIANIPSEAARAATARATTMRLDSYTGTVSVHTMNGMSRKAAKGMRLLNGYEVGTSAASSAYINLDDTKAVKLDEKTQVQVRQAGKQLELMTKTGNVFFNVKKKLASNESLRIRSSTLVTGVRGTSAYVTVDSEKTRVYLLEGNLKLTEIDPDTGKVNTVSITGGEAAVSYKYATDKVDVTTEKFTEGDVPYFVLEEVAKDEALQKKMDALSPLSTEKLLKIKDNMDQGMTHEEAVEKVEDNSDHEGSNVQIPSESPSGEPSGGGSSGGSGSIGSGSSGDNSSGSGSGSSGDNSSGSGSNSGGDNSSGNGTGSGGDNSSGNGTGAGGDTTGGIGSGADNPASPEETPGEEPPGSGGDNTTPPEGEVIDTVTEGDFILETYDAVQSASIMARVFSVSRDKTAKIIGLSDEGKTKTEITIPKNAVNSEYTITDVEAGLFKGNTTIQKLTILADLESIPDNMCYNCKNLSGIAMPESTISIGTHAFLGCSNLTNIQLPKKVENIGDSAFWECSGLTSVELPSTLTSIGDWAFYDCSGLTSVVIPEGITSIGDSAFYNCTGLTELNLPSILTSIGDWAFYGCSGLTSVELPSTLTSIGDSVFSGCNSLTSITLPKEVTGVYSTIFTECTGRVIVYDGKEYTNYTDLNAAIQAAHSSTQ